MIGGGAVLFVASAFAGPAILPFLGELFISQVNHKWLQQKRVPTDVASSTNQTSYQFFVAHVDGLKVFETAHNQYSPKIYNVKKTFAGASGLGGVVSLGGAMVARNACIPPFCRLDKH